MYTIEGPGGAFTPQSNRQGCVLITVGTPMTPIEVNFDFEVNKLSFHHIYPQGITSIFEGIHTVPHTCKDNHISTPDKTEGEGPFRTPLEINATPLAAMRRYMRRKEGP